MQKLNLIQRARATVDSHRLYAEIQQHPAHKMARVEAIVARLVAHGYELDAAHIETTLRTLIHILDILEGAILASTHTPKSL